MWCLDEGDKNSSMTFDNISRNVASWKAVKKVEANI